MEKSGPRFVVLSTKTLDDVFPNRPLNWKTFSTQGYNVAKGKHVDLTLVLKTN
jgi:hypothetical protein